jgi:preprotein translocase subunit SecG
VYTFLIVLLILDSALLGTVVLLQSGKGGGLAALGGGASSDTFFGGRQAVTILTKLSWWCGGIFLFIALVLAGLSTRGGAPRSVLEEDLSLPTPVAPAAPLPLNVEPGGEQPAGQQQPQQPPPGSGN